MEEYRDTGNECKRGPYTYDNFLYLLRLSISEVMGILKGKTAVKLPQQELGASFGYKQKTSLSPSGCRYISRQESGVLCGLIKLFKGFSALKKKPYWENHFWSRGYCVSTIGLDENKIRRYVKYQEEREKKEESEQQEFSLF